MEGGPLLHAPCSLGDAHGVSEIVICYLGTIRANGYSLPSLHHLSAPTNMEAAEYTPIMVVPSIWINDVVSPSLESLEY